MYRHRCLLYVNVVLGGYPRRELSACSGPGASGEVSIVVPLGTEAVSVLMIGSPSAEDCMTAEATEVQTAGKSSVTFHVMIGTVIMTTAGRLSEVMLMMIAAAGMARGGARAIKVAAGGAGSVAPAMTASIAMSQATAEWCFARSARTVRRQACQKYWPGGSARSKRLATVRPMSQSSGRAMQNNGSPALWCERERRCSGQASRVALCDQDTFGDRCMAMMVMVSDSLSMRTAAEMWTCKRTVTVGCQVIASRQTRGPQMQHSHRRQLWRTEQVNVAKAIAENSCGEERAGLATHVCMHMYIHITCGERLVTHVCAYGERLVAD